MLFNSAVFILVFLPITLLGFFALGARGSQRLAIAWLVLASAVFYGWFKIEYLLLIAALVVFNYAFGIKLSRDRQLARARPLSLALGVGVNLAVLGYYKYTNFFIDSANALLGTSFVLQAIILPLGISFFTFQKIAYLVDAYRGEAEEYNFLDFSLFVMFFPQLVAGPIVHHKEIIPQFRNPSIFRLSPIDLAAGIALFTLGFAKKAWVADTVVTWSDPVFAAAKAGAAPSLFEAWSGALAFTFQIYFDFSGYTDMALGIALMFGIRLPLNFNSPYKATNIVDFWRCWHMTLSRFLRDYVYIPLGGNRRGVVRRYINLMLTMLLGGLWHGAAWTFVAWGALHGLYLSINHGWQAGRARLGLGPWGGAVARWTARIFTFVAVVMGWVFFRAETFSSAWAILRGMIGLNGVTVPAGYVNALGSVGETLQVWFLRADASLAADGSHLWRAAGLAVLLFVVWGLPNSQELLGRFRPALTALEPARLTLALRSGAQRLGLVGADGSVALTASTGLMVGAILIGGLIYQGVRTTTLTPFIYFQF